MYYEEETKENIQGHNFKWCQNDNPELHESSTIEAASFIKNYQEETNYEDWPKKGKESDNNTETVVEDSLNDWTSEHLEDDEEVGYDN